MENKKLCKILENRMVCGVCAGIASYFKVDVTVVRLIFCFLAISGGSGIALYLVAAFLMPSEDEKQEKTQKQADASFEEEAEDDADTSFEEKAEDSDNT